MLGLYPFEGFSVHLAALETLIENTFPFSTLEQCKNEVDTHLTALAGRLSDEPRALTLVLALRKDFKLLHGKAANKTDRILIDNTTQRLMVNLRCLRAITDKL